MKKTFLLFALLAIFTFKPQAQTVIDYDGNVYNTVTIGTQLWLDENLKVTHYANGDSIPNIINSTDWGNLTTGAYADFENVPDSSETYGRLYNWYAVDNGHLCPTGWHVPTHDEWITLTSFLGGVSVAGGKLKETGTTHWQSPNTGATNFSGFTALPGGYRKAIGAFINITYNGYWWTSSPGTAGNAYSWSLSWDSAEAFWYNNSIKILGYSVRCICDLGAGVNQIKNNTDMDVYPNPANGLFTLVLNHDLINADLSLWNINAAQVMEKTNLTGSKFEFDISNQPNGMYFIQIIEAGSISRIKLLKN